MRLKHLTQPTWGVRVLINSFDHPATSVLVVERMGNLRGYGGLALGPKSNDETDMASPRCIYSS